MKIFTYDTVVMQHVINLDEKPLGVMVTPAPLFEKPMFPFSMVFPFLMVPTPIAPSPLPGFSFLNIHESQNLPPTLGAPSHQMNFNLLHPQNVPRKFWVDLDYS